MWRNSQSLYSKLVFSRNPNPNPTFLTSSSISSLDAIVRPFSIASDGTRTVGSTINTTSLSARDAVDLARHYGRCYCELSKARLRLGFQNSWWFLFDFGNKIRFNFGFEKQESWLGYCFVLFVLDEISCAAFLERIILELTELDFLNPPFCLMKNKWKWKFDYGISCCFGSGAKPNFQ